MKKIVKILFAILLMSVMVLTISACTQAEDPCEKGYHAYTGVVTKEATCTQEGEITYTCARCSATYTDALPKIAHTPVTVEGKPATCKDAGLKDGVKCSVCNAVLTEQEALALVGHKFGDWQQKTAPTCDTDGVLARKCSVCDKEEERAIPAAHTWDTGKVTKVATCVDFGERQYTCTVCGETTTAVIARTDHSYGEWIEQVEPTFDQSGTLGHYTCSICGQYFDADHNLLEDLELIQTSARRVTINAAHATVTDLAGEALADRYEVGSHITFRVAPAYGFELTAVLINGKTVKPDAGIYLFDIAEADSSYTITVQTKAIDLSVRLTVDLKSALPDYLSVWFTGGATTWATSDDQAQMQRVGVEGKLLEGTTSTYYFDIVLNMGKDQWNSYNITLGYKQSTGVSNWGVNYNFKSAESGSYDVPASFTVEDGATVISLGTHTWASMPIDATPVDVTFAVEFAEAVPSKYVAWLVGGFGAQDGEYWWENGKMQMTANGDRTKFTATATLAKGNLGVNVEFQVILTIGATFSWDGTVYGGTAGEYRNNGLVFVPADPQAEVSLFDSPREIPAEDSYILVGAATGLAWDETTTNKSVMFTEEGGVYKITYSFKADDQFKIKKNSKGWDWQIDYNSARTVTFDSGVTNKSDLFKDGGGGNIGVKYACTLEITLNVSAKSIAVKVTALDAGSAVTEKWMLTGSINTWATSTTDSKYMFVNTGGSTFELTYTFKVNDEWKIKKNSGTWNGDAGWYNERMLGETKTYFSDSSGNIKCKTAGTYKIVFDSSTLNITVTKIG